MDKKRTELLAEVEAYYTRTLNAHGLSPRGVDWNGAQSQQLRFEQLCRLLPDEGAFSVNDLGCGYGALYDHLRDRYSDFDYRGFDLSEAMIQAARSRQPESAGLQFETGSTASKAADFSLASGVLNVRQSQSDEAWHAHVLEVLDELHRSSLKGFAFNCLSSYSDIPKRRPHLYYADPLACFDLCKKRYSEQVALLHDYGLYEFTMIVRKVL